MFLFARESQYVTATNKIMFWLAIFGTGFCGVMFVAGRTNAVTQNADIYYPALLVVGLAFLFCAAAMISMMFGKRVGGYAAIGFCLLFVVGISLLSLPIKDYDLFNLAGASILVLWPTLMTLFGVKRINQLEVDLKNELKLKGSTLGKVLFGAMYLLTVLTIVFGIIGIFRT